MTQSDQIKSRLRKRLNLTNWKAVIANGPDGSPNVPQQPGWIYVQIYTSNGLSTPTAVRFRAVTSADVGNPVLVGYDETNNISVISADFDGQAAVGINPLASNTLSDPNVSNEPYINQYQITTLWSGPISSSIDSMLVTVFPWIYAQDGTVHWFLGGDGTGESPVDLTSYIPGSAGMQCLVCLFVDDSDLIEIQASTPIPNGDPFDPTDDLQQCFTAASSGAQRKPVIAYHLYNGQTGIKPGFMDNGGDVFLDLRQFINVPSTSGSGTVTSVGLSTDASYLTVGSSPVTGSGTITIDKTTGLSANQVVATPNGSTGAADLRSLVDADLPVALAGHTITGGSVDNTPIGATTPNTGAFTSESMTLFLDAAETTTPTTPAADHARVWVADDNGFTLPQYEDSIPTVLSSLRDHIIVAKNNSGSTISAQAAVKLITVSSGIICATLATATAGGWNGMGCDGFAMDTALNGAFMRVMLFGILPFDTSAFTAGNRLYLDPATPGAINATGAVDPSNGWRYWVGMALDKSASGHILVNIKGADPSNIPELIGLSGDLTFFNSSHNQALRAATLTNNRVMTLPDANDTVAGQSPANGGTGQAGGYTKGDILVATAATTLAKQGVGTDLKRLVADSSKTNGIDWTYSGSEVLVANTRLGSDSTISLSSFSSAFKHLHLILQLRSDRAASTNDGIKITFNGDTGSNYSWALSRISEVGTSAGAQQNGVAAIIPNVCVPAASSASGHFGVMEVWILNYNNISEERFVNGIFGFPLTASTFNNGQFYGIWNNTANAISSIQIAPSNGTNFKTGSSYELIGIG